MSVELNSDNLSNRHVVVSACGLARDTNASVWCVDYNSIRRFDLATDRFDPDVQSAPVTLNPAGVHVDQDRLYVANYTQNNILVFAIVGNRLEFERAVGNDFLIGPEGVFADEDGILAADYSASSVVAMDRAGRKLWTVHLGLAHGVCATERFVYATGLSTSRVVKMRRRTGEIVKVIDDATWGKGYVYPTQISRLSGSSFPGTLLIVDADSGRLSILDDDLRLRWRFGRNEPSLWQRPYGATQDGRDLIVADTEGRRLWRVTPEGQAAVISKNPNRQAIGRPQRWGRRADIGCSFTPAVAPGYTATGGWTGNQVVCLPLVKRSVVRQRWPLWAVPKASRVNWAIHARMIWPIGGFFPNRPPNGFGHSWQAARSRDGVEYRITGSPNREIVMVARGDDYVFTRLPAGLSIWSGDGTDAELDAALMQSLTDEWPRHDDLVARHGPLVGFLRYGYCVAETLDEAIEKAMLLAPAKAMAKRWLNGHVLTRDEIDNAVLDGTSYLDDVSLLLRMAASTPLRERIRFRRSSP